MGRKQLLEKLGLKGVIAAYDYFSSRDEDTIVEDIKAAIEAEGIHEGEERYYRMLNDYRRYAADLKNIVAKTPREEVYDVSGYQKLQREFGFPRKEEDFYYVSNDKSVVRSAAGDVWNFITLKNRRGRVLIIGYLVYALAVSFLTGFKLEKLGYFAVMGILGGGWLCFVIFLGGIGKYRRRARSRRFPGSRFTDAMEDFWDEPDERRNDPEANMTDEQRKYISKL